MFPFYGKIFATDKNKRKGRDNHAASWFPYCVWDYALQRQTQADFYDGL